MRASVLKSIGAVVVGGLTAVVGYWMAAVIALVAMHGIPLGSSGGPPTTADVSAHVLFAAAASLGGGFVATRIADYKPRMHALVLGGVLALLAFLGFSKPSSNWPDWFPYGMAAACAGGAFVASRWAPRRTGSRT